MISKTSRVAVVLSSLMLAFGGLAGCSSSPTTEPSTGNSSGGGTGSSSGSGSGSGSSSSSGGGSTATVSFAKDVVPIFQMSCSVGGATCHGDTSVNMGQAAGNRQYLGPMSGTYAAADITKVLGDILNVKSFADPTMNVVTPGDATKSFLMHKMDGAQMSLAAQCTTGTPSPPCGTLMPWLGTILPQTQRDTVRSWINQGAKNN